MMEKLYILIVVVVTQIYIGDKITYRITHVHANQCLLNW